MDKPAYLFCSFFIRYTLIGIIIEKKRNRYCNFFLKNIFQRFFATADVD